MSDEGDNDVREAFREVLEKFDIELAPLQPLSKEDERTLREGDMAEIISKTQEKIDTLHEQAEEILKKTGMSREELDTYVANPNNFSKDQWDAIEKLRQATEELKRKSLKATVTAGAGAAKTKARQKKKQAKRFGKKKDWIPL